jgi:hypothetical protein
MFAGSSVLAAGILSADIGFRVKQRTFLGVCC